MSSIKFWTAGNITYGGFTYNTRILAEYKHTGKQYFYKVKYKGKWENRYTENQQIAEEKKANGIEVTEKEGYYFLERIAIPTINAKGEEDIWYINNPGDYYKVNKASKFWNKRHHQLSQHQIPIAN